jgi:hypothetical protein
MMFTEEIKKTYPDWEFHAQSMVADSGRTAANSLMILGSKNWLMNLKAKALNLICGGQCIMSKWRRSG